MHASTTIWVTRPEPQATTAANALIAAGFDAVAAPVMEIIPKEDWQVPDKKPDAIIITSQQAADALKKLPHDWKNLPVYVVGEKSAEAVAALGWSPHKPEEPGALPMLALIESEQKKDANMLYLAGNILRWDIPSLLEEKGYHATPLTVYASKAVESLPEAVQHAIGENRLTALTCFSPRSAEIAAKLLRDNEHGHLLESLTAMCISEDCAVAARKAGFAHTTIAKGTGSDAMVQLAAAKNPDTHKGMPMRRQFYGIFIVLVAVIGVTGLLAWQNMQMQASIEQARDIKPAPAPAPEPAPAPQPDPDMVLGQLRAELQQEIAAIKESARSEMASSVAKLETTIAGLQENNQQLKASIAKEKKKAQAKAREEAVAKAMSEIPSDLLYAWLGVQHAVETSNPYASELEMLAASLPESARKSDAFTQLAAHAATPVASRDMLKHMLLSAVAAAPEPETVEVLDETITDEVGVMGRMQRLLNEHVQVVKLEDAHTNTLAKKLAAHANHGELAVASRLIASNAHAWPALKAWQTEYQQSEAQHAALRALAKIIGAKGN